MSASRELSKFEVIVGGIRQKIMVVSRVCELRLSVLAGRAGIAVRILPRPPFFYFCGVAVAVSKELVAREIADNCVKWHARPDLLAFASVQCFSS